MNLKGISFLIPLCLLSACELIDYHPYDGRLDTDSDINRKNIDRIKSICEQKDTIRFVMMGDTNRTYDEMRFLSNKSINEMILIL